MTLTLPDWMVHRIVAILEDHEYTGASEIANAIKAHVETDVMRGIIPSESNG